MYRVPASLRADLKTPMGPVLSGGKALEVLAAAETLVTVGDVVTETCLEAGLVPKLMIVDGRTKRSDLPHDPLQGLDTDVRTLTAANPAATITDELWQSVETGLASTSPVVLDVDGEEDLAALPVILLAPMGTTVAYGQPDEGVVVLQVDAAAKDHARDLLARMET